ncbi:hypothetical protein [Burkholderia ubonensis]|uniref:hypothetical protein n=1 Tax=Burkholderia ubonensis TaxID=101571 RepID=UPI000A6B0856|nr:hypothetical protein [Burkholderia ubonensis]
MRELPILVFWSDTALSLVAPMFPKDGLPAKSNFGYLDLGGVLAGLGRTRLAGHLVPAHHTFLLLCSNAPFETGGIVAWTYPEASA